MQFLLLYEKESGQLISRGNSYYVVGEKVSRDRCQIIEEVTGFQRKKLPINYLGCTLFTGRKKIDYFGSILKKIEKKLIGWKAKTLSHGARIVLIKHVFQSLSFYNLAAIDPPKAILQRIDSICVNFLWSEGDHGFKYHWVAWNKCCLPFHEGGLGFRCMQDFCTAFSM